MCNKKCTKIVKISTCSHTLEKKRRGFPERGRSFRNTLSIGVSKWKGEVEGSGSRRENVESCVRIFKTIAKVIASHN